MFCLQELVNVFFLLFFVTYVIISPEPQCDGGQVKRISHEVSHVPHITDISLGTRVPKLLNLTPYQTCTETCQKNTNILHIHNSFFCAHAPRPLSRNFLQMAETLQKNLGHCHIEWHSNRVSRIGGKGGVLDLALCSMFFVRLGRNVRSWYCHSYGGCVWLSDSKIRSLLSNNNCSGE